MLFGEGDSSSSLKVFNCPIPNADGNTMKHIEILYIPSRKLQETLQIYS